MERVLQVVARDDFQLDILFDKGEWRRFDARPYLQKEVFRRLQDVSLFKQAFVAIDTVCWPGDLDIAPETLFERSVVMEASR
jgi:hypothetical protein